MRPKFCVNLYLKKNGQLFAAYRFYTFDPSIAKLELHDCDVEDRKIKNRRIKQLFDRDKDEACYFVNTQEYRYVCRREQEMADDYEKLRPAKAVKIVLNMQEPTPVPPHEFMVELSILEATRSALVGLFGEMKRPVPTLPKEITFLDDEKQMLTIRETSTRLSTQVKRQSVLEAYLAACGKSLTIRPKQIDVSELSETNATAISRIMREPPFYVELQKMVRKKINQAGNSTKKSFWIKVERDIADRVEKRLQQITKQKVTPFREVDGSSRNDRKRSGAGYHNPYDEDAPDDL